MCTTLPIHPICLEPNTQTMTQFSPIKLSSTAVQRLKELLSQQNNKKFRIRVISGGCSGLQYQFSFDSENENDIMLEQDGIQYIIDSQSMPYIQGSTIQYITQFAGAYFTVHNPNATSSCGCGTSFSVSL